MLKNSGISGDWTTQHELEFIDRLGLHGVNMGSVTLEGNALLEYRSQCYAGYLEGARLRQWVWMKPTGGVMLNEDVCVARARKRLNEIKSQMAQETDGVAA